jgi:hypothetical protein
MKKTFNKKGKLINIELDKGEQLELIRENLRRCRAAINKKNRKESERIPTGRKKAMYGMFGLRAAECGC